MKPNLIARFITIVFAMMIVPAAFAQATGSLSGTVADPNNALVQGANVTIKNQATNFTRNATTNDEGH